MASRIEPLSAEVRLGAFVLESPLGKGGMGVVWKGRHAADSTPVAVKVVTAERARKGEYRTEFRNEVQAVAGLDHPGIVMVLDYGEVSTEADAQSEGRLVAGSPYLVMELAEFGALDQCRAPLAWVDVRGVLLSLLDALAHAHARGVIHRDLKPANVLLAGGGYTRAGLKLSDFGIAHAAERQTRSGSMQETASSTEAAAGTPYYMAPEQFHGHWRDYGPWTDLYSLGCMAWELASGRPPFAGDSVLQLALQHLRDRPAAMEARSSVPAGFEDWARELLEKEPGRRFQRAADAAWALARLGDPLLPERVRPRLFGPGGFDGSARRITGTVQAVAEDGEAAAAHGDTLVMPDGYWESRRMEESAAAASPGDALGTLATLDGDTFRATQRAVEGGGTGGPDRVERREELGGGAAPPQGVALADRRFSPRTPPMPGRWAHPAGARRSMKLVGAGLGLYGLRTIPLVDRDAERDAIWRALQAVRAGTGSRAMLLRGSAGNGKSRLVEWMSERAHEVGAATVLSSTHSAVGGGDGLPRLLARHFRTVGLTREEILRRVERALRELGVRDDYEWHAITEILSPSDGDSAKAGRVIRFSAPVERHVVVRRVLERLSQERPVIVRLDDVQWGADSLAFVINVLQSRSGAAILFLMTARDEALAEREQESSLVRDVLGLSSAGSLTVPPLAVEDRRQLVQELLALEGRLAAEVEARTAGNPLFAVQLVGDWVQRGVLRVGESGFVLRSGEQAQLPDNLHQVWMAQIQRLLADRPPDALVALEIAAALGSEIEEGEWAEACAQARCAVPPGLVGMLSSRRLALRADGGWSFAHGMLRESLERNAREQGRSASQHAACAAMLKRRYPASARGVAERLGHHLVAAGALEAAIDPLLQGARERVALSEYEAALALLTERQRLLRDVAAAPDDPRHGDGWCLRADVYRLRWKFDEAFEWAARAEAAATQYHWSRALPRAIEILAQVARQRGELRRAAELFRQAMSLLDRQGDSAGAARCLQGLGILARQSGDLDESAQLYSSAAERFRAVQDPLRVAHCLLGLGHVARRRDDLLSARRWYGEALVEFEKAGDLHEVANSLNGLAEVARFEGRLSEAEEGYRRVIGIHEAIGSRGVTIPTVNLALVLLGLGDYAGARPLLDRCLAELEEGGQRGFLGCVHAELLPCAAHALDWEAWDRHMDGAQRLLAETGTIDPDVAWPAQLGGDLASDAGEPARAVRAWDLARKQWQALGRLDRVREIEQSQHAAGIA